MLRHLTQCSISMSSYWYYYYYYHPEGSLSGQWPGELPESVLSTVQLIQRPQTGTCSGSGAGWERRQAVPTHHRVASGIPGPLPVPNKHHTSCLAIVTHASPDACWRLRPHTVSISPWHMAPLWPAFLFKWWRQPERCHHDILKLNLCVIEGKHEWGRYTRTYTPKKELALSLGPIRSGFKSKLWHLGALWPWEVV